MKQKRSLSKGKKIAIVLLAVFFMVYLAVPVLAETIEELERQTEISKENISKANYQIDQTQTTIDGIEQEIVKSNEILGSIQNDIDSVTSQINSLTNQINETQKKLNEVIAQKEEQEKAMAERIRVQYMYGSDGYLEAMFSGETVTEQMENSEVVKDLVTADKELLEKLETTKKTIEELKAQLESKQKELDSKKGQLQTRQQQQQRIKDQQQQLLNKNQKLIEEAKAQIRQEEQAISEANRKIQEISRQAEQNKINEQVGKVQSVSETARAASEESNASLQSLKTDFAEETDEKITGLIEESDSYNNEINDSVAKIDQVLEETQSAATAPEAVEVSKEADSELAVVLNNKALVKKNSAEIREYDLERKKTDTSDVDKEELERQIQAGQQDAESRAYEAEKRAKEFAERARKEYEEAQKDLIEEEPSEDTQPSQPAEPSSDYISSTGWRWPLNDIYDITSLFGYRIHPIFGQGMGHEGIDIGAATGTEIHACDGGTVILAEEYGGYGNCVIVQQDSGHQVYYAHQSAFNVVEGQRVEKGDVIGYVGSTGWSTGPHLHLGVLVGGSFVDPFDYFPEVANMS